MLLSAFHLVLATTSLPTSLVAAALRPPTSEAVDRSTTNPIGSFAPG